MTSAPSLSLKARALRYLALREHTRVELECKLAPYAADDPACQAELTRVLDELAVKGFINEARVVESTLHARAGKLGMVRVLHELRRKGVGGAALAEAAQTLRGTELERARAAWCKKFSAASNPASLGDPAAVTAARAKQLRFLAARGFPDDIAWRVVREAENRDVQ